MSVDRESYVEAFCEEAGEHLVRLAEGILALEHAWPDLDLVAALFRSAHTIKGGANLLGLAPIADTAHGLEDVLDALRNGKRSLSADVVDELLLGTDALRQQVQELDAARPAASTTSEAAEPPVPEPPMLEPPAPPNPAAAPLPARPLDGARQVPAVPPAGSHALGGPGLIARPAAAAPDAGLGAEPGRAPGAARGEAEGERSVRVSVEKLDRVLDLAGELLVHERAARLRAQAAQALWTRITNYERVLAEGTPVAQHAAWTALRTALGAWHRTAVRGDERAGELADELHYEVGRLRMFSLASVFGVFTRTVRDMARAQEKEVRLTIEGEATAVDKQILEGLRDPLLHLVRNAVDHGIEAPAMRVASGKSRQGTIALRGRQQGGQVIITVEDDGAGVDLAAVRAAAVERGLASGPEAAALDEAQTLTLLLRPGFSTRREVGATAGRGVGLDVVKREVEALKGSLAIAATRGQGTCFTLTVPLSLALLRVLLVRARGQQFALPLAAVQGVLALPAGGAERVQGQPTLGWDDHLLAVLPLAGLLGVPDAPSEPNGHPRTAVVLAAGEGALAVIVDDVLGEENLVARPLPRLLGALPLVSGVAPLSEQELAIVLYPEMLVAHARRQGRPAAATVDETRPPRRVLIVDDSLITRELERDILEAAGYLVDTAVDGLEALARLGERPYDLVVADVEMPRLGGLELAARLRTLPALARLPVVIVSARADDAERQHGLAAGARAFLAKSTIEHGDLLETVQRLLG